MAVEWFRVSLRGYGGPEPTGTRFFESIGASAAGEVVLDPSDSPWKAALVGLLLVDMEDCRGAAEPSEEFAARTDAGLRRVAGWLASLPVTGFAEWRASGRTADVFVGGWMDSDQFDLTFPPEFLYECGRLGLPIQICTND
jgi:hypothetical protein